MIFESDSTSSILAVAENVAGKIMSFGNVTPVEATGQTPNLNTTRSTIQKKSYAIVDIIQALLNLSAKLDKDKAKELQEIIEKLKNL